MVSLDITISLLPSKILAGLFIRTESLETLSRFASAFSRRSRQKRVTKSIRNPRIVLVKFLRLKYDKNRSYKQRESLGSLFV